MTIGERILEDEAATAALGAAIAARLRPGDLVSLSGPLGAGKSVLARGLVRALTSPEEEAPSPTFTLIQSYPGAVFPVAHLDLYRLKQASEAWELGLEDALAEGAAVVEWPERLGGDMPADRLAITLRVATAADAGPPLKAACGLHGWKASGHGPNVSPLFSDPRSLQPAPDLGGRGALKAAFLALAGLDDARREPVAGDASTRAYERLHPASGGAPLILMDAPPAAESGVAPPGVTDEQRIALGYNAMARLAGGRVEAFVAVADWLRGRGLSAPAVHAVDAEHGFALLEDLGADLFVDRLAAGDDPLEVYGQAVDLLLALHEEPPPAQLPVRGGGAWPLEAYDALALKTGVDLFTDWWPRLTGLPRVQGVAAAEEWLALWTPVLARGDTGATVFTHRDYHAENLLWLPQRQGAARVGLLDFQDAVRGHPAWDLLHLLQDARRDVAPEVEAAMLDRYLAGRPDLDREAFLADYALLGALNAARILGPVFARQIVLFGRDKYRAFLPRTWRSLERNLAHPQAAGLKAWFDRNVPAEARA